MGLVTGTLREFRAAVAERRHVEEVEEYVRSILNDIDMAIQEKETFIIVDTHHFEKVERDFKEDGYTVKVIDDEKTILSGWA